MTVKDLWDKTTCDIYLYRGEDKEPLKLPTGGRLQIEHAELQGVDIILRGRLMEPPYLVVKAGKEETA